MSADQQQYLVKPRHVDGLRVDGRPEVDRGGSRAIGGTQFRDDIVQMDFDRVLSHAKLGGDVLVLEPAGEQVHDLAFAHGEGFVRSDTPLATDCGRRDSCSVENGAGEIFPAKRHQPDHREPDVQPEAHGQHAANEP
jgi:hypothetical protein